MGDEPREDSGDILRTGAAPILRNCACAFANRRTGDEGVAIMTTLPKAATSLSSPDVEARSCRVRFTLRHQRGRARDHGDHRTIRPAPTAGPGSPLSRAAA